MKTILTGLDSETVRERWGASSLTLHTGACLRKPTPSKLMSPACCTRGETHWKPLACKLTQKESCAIAYLKELGPSGKLFSTSADTHDCSNSSWLLAVWLMTTASTARTLSLRGWPSAGGCRIDIRGEMLNVIHSRCRLWLPSRVDEVTLPEQRAQAIITETTCHRWTGKRSLVVTKERFPTVSTPLTVMPMSLNPGQELMRTVKAAPRESVARRMSSLSVSASCL